jgi:hypothetical protein
VGRGYFKENYGKEVNYKRIKAYKTDSVKKTTKITLNKLD